MADTTRLDELTEQWQTRGLKYDDAAEFINLLLAERKDLCSGPHLTLASTEELLEALERLELNPATGARVAMMLTLHELRREWIRRKEQTVDDPNAPFTQEYPATPDESFAIEEGSTLSSGAEARERVAATWELLDEPLRSRIVEEAAAHMTITCIDEFAHTGDTEPAAPGSLDHLEILAERREDLLREMLESLSRIEEALIVAKPPSWKECDHAWVETTGGKRCSVCGVTIMPRLT